jgi:hypothetical protein
VCGGVGPDSDQPRIPASWTRLAKERKLRQWWKRVITRVNNMGTFMERANNKPTPLINFLRGLNCNYVIYKSGVSLGWVT